MCLVFISKLFRSASTTRRLAAKGFNFRHHFLWTNPETHQESHKYKTMRLPSVILPSTGAGKIFNLTVATEKTEPIMIWGLWKDHIENYHVSVMVWRCMLGRSTGSSLATTNASSHQGMMRALTWARQFQCIAWMCLA